MAKERGWWKLIKGNTWKPTCLMLSPEGSYMWALGTTVEPDDVDLEHIVELIKEGYVEGEICKSE